MEANKYKLEIIMPTVTEMRISANKYAAKEWANDFTGDYKKYCRNDFIEGAEWMKSEIEKNNTLLVNKTLKL